MSAAIEMVSTRVPDGWDESCWSLADEIALAGIGLTTYTACELADFAREHLVACGPRAKQRRVSVGEIASLISDHARIVAAALADGGADTVRSRVVGGYVANSYGYAAESDYVEIATDTTGTTWRVGRGRASSRSHGAGRTTIHRRIAPGQSQGRIVEVPA